MPVPGLKIELTIFDKTWLCDVEKGPMHGTWTDQKDIFVRESGGKRVRRKAKSFIFDSLALKCLTKHCSGCLDSGCAHLRCSQMWTRHVLLWRCSIHTMERPKLLCQVSAAGVVNSTSQRIPGEWKYLERKWGVVGMPEGAPCIRWHSGIKKRLKWSFSLSTWGVLCINDFYKCSFV